MVDLNGGRNYLFNDEFEHDLRCRSEIVDLNKFCFVESVVRCQRAEKRMFTLVKRHWP